MGREKAIFKNINAESVKLGNVDVEMYASSETEDVCSEMSRNHLSDLKKRLLVLKNRRAEAEQRVSHKFTVSIVDT